MTVGAGSISLLKNDMFTTHGIHGISRSVHVNQQPQKMPQFLSDEMPCNNTFYYLKNGHIMLSPCPSVHPSIWVFTRGQFWPLGIVVACICPSVCLSLRPSVSPSVTKFVRAIIHHPFKLESLNLDHRCKRPYCFWGWLTVTFKVKFHFKVKIYPVLCLWVFPCD